MSKAGFRCSSNAVDIYMQYTQIRRTARLSTGPAQALGTDTCRETIKCFVGQSYCVLQGKFIIDQVFTSEG